MARQRKYTKDYMEEKVRASMSVAELIRNCGCVPSGGMHRLMRSYLVEYKIDTTHFSGQLWSKGKKIPSKTPDESIFIKDKHIKRSTVRKRFKQRSVYKCLICDNNGVWRGASISLHMDHIDGDHTNNTLENLRWLCPNCHQQTKTWGTKK